MFLKIHSLTLVTQVIPITSQLFASHLSILNNILWSQHYNHGYRTYCKSEFGKQEIMPFFSNKFSPLKIPARKSDKSIISRELGPDFAQRELGLEFPPIRLKLGGQELVFQDGQWIQESGPPGEALKENIKLKKMIKGLEEENNLLKLKFEIILDMLTQTTAESQLQLKEIELLKQSTDEAIPSWLRKS